MEKWKIGVIMALLGLMLGYGLMSQRVTNETVAETAKTSSSHAAKSQTLAAKSLIGQAAKPWKFSAENWVNTPAPVKLDDLKGDIAIIEFFRIDCTHCQSVAPQMEQLYQTYKARGVKFIGIQSAITENENDWPNVQKTLKTWGIKYPVAFDEKGEFFKTSYKGTNFPTFFLLDRSGKIIFVESGEKVPLLEEAVRQALGLQAINPMLRKQVLAKPNSPQ